LYFSRWKNFDKENDIKSKHIPWPVDDPKNITQDSIVEFLFSGVSSTESRRSILRQEQIRFHPDRWQKWTRKMRSEKEKLKIMDRVNQVSQALNALWEGRNEDPCFKLH